MAYALLMVACAFLLIMMDYGNACELKIKILIASHLSARQENWLRPWLAELHMRLLEINPR